MKQLRKALNKGVLPSGADEQPRWTNDEDELARLCGSK